MRRIICLISVVLVVAPAVLAARLPLGTDVSLPLISGWQIEENDTTFPYHLYNEQRTAEMIVFESVLERDEMVEDTTGFRETVDQVIRTIFYDLPDILILSNTGYYYDSLAKFEVEFQSRSDEIQGKLHHRFAGILIRRNDNRQVLYSLWGKASQEAAVNDLLDIKMMQDSFAYNGQLAEHVFVTERNELWYYFLPLVAIFLLLIVIRRKQSNLARVRFSQDDRVWRCSCGRLNHDRQTACRRCGQPRPTVEIT